MSRRKGEFEHRTSIFEGAYRAWSYLGGCDPQKLVAKDATEILDPITKPHIGDRRFRQNQDNQDRQQQQQQQPHGGGDDGNDYNNNISNSNPEQQLQPHEINYAYEPLPRSGLAHPFVQGIIAPWLGPLAHEEDVKNGLTTLRTWWQHRRRGESASAIKALGTDRMKVVVQGYTKHFFNLALCMVVNDKEQPPKSLFGKLRLERKQDSENELGNQNQSNGGDINSDTNNVGQHANRDAFGNNEDGALHSMSNHHQPLPMSVVRSKQQLDASNHSFIMEQEQSNTDMLPVSATNNGGGGCCGGGGGGGNRRRSSSNQDLSIASGAGSTGSRTLKRKDLEILNGDIDNDDNMSNASSNNNSHSHSHSHSHNHRRRKNNRVRPSSSSSNNKNHYEYGDPTRTPVVLVSANGDIQIAMAVQGITCSQCVKMIETVLCGIDSSQPHIHGLLDSVGDRDLSAVIIKINKAGNAKRIAHEAAKILKFVGYEAVAREMDVLDKNGKEVDFHDLSAAFDVVGNNDTMDDIDWSLKCNCPDDGSILPDCERHSQMNKRIFEAFDRREQLLRHHVAGCSRKYGLKCSCPPGTCKCKSGCCKTPDSQQPQHSSLTDSRFNALNPMFLNPSNPFSQQIGSQMNHGHTTQQQHLQPQSPSNNPLNLFQQHAALAGQLGQNVGLTASQQNALYHSGFLQNDPSAAANGLYAGYMANANTGGPTQQQQLQHLLLQQQQQQQQQRLSMMNNVNAPASVGSGGVNVSGIGNTGVGVNGSLDPNAIQHLNHTLNHNLNMNSLNSLNDLNNHSSAASDSFRYDHNHNRNNGYDTR